MSERLKVWPSFTDRVWADGGGGGRSCKMWLWVGEGGRWGSAGRQASHALCVEAAPSPRPALRCRPPAGHAGLSPPYSPWRLRPHPFVPWDHTPSQVGGPGANVKLTSWGATGPGAWRLNPMTNCIGTDGVYACMGVIAICSARKRLQCATWNTRDNKSPCKYLNTWPRRIYLHFRRLEFVCALLQSRHTILYP